MPELVSVECPTCRHSFRARRELLGTTKRCPLCGCEARIQAGPAPAPAPQTPVVQDEIAEPANIVPQPVESPPETTPPAQPITPAMREYLRKTRPWAIVLSIWAFVNAAAILCLFLKTGKAGSRASRQVAEPGLPRLATRLGMTAAYVLMGCLMLKYGAAIRRFLTRPTSAELEEALRAQKSVWRCVGILSLLVTAVLIVVILFVVAGWLGR